ncbi:MAG: type II CAAX endopeptidase family protein [Pseudomonadota bacterium]
MTWVQGLRHGAALHPRRAAMVILGLFVLVMTLPVLILGTEDLTNGTGTLDFETLTGGLPWQIILTTALLGGVWLLGWWRLTLLRSQLDRRGLRPLYATLAYPLLGMIVFTAFLREQDSAHSPLSVLGLVLALNFFVGLSEELLFRGIIFGALRQKNRLITAIFVSSIAFGALHLVNAGVGQGLQQTLFQIINATALGVLFCGLTLSANSLWPAIVLHMIWNSYAMMGVASAEVLGEVPGAPVEPPDLSPWSLTLPALILLIAMAILYGYRLNAGIRFRDVVPGPKANHPI